MIAEIVAKAAETAREVAAVQEIDLASVVTDAENIANEIWPASGETLSPIKAKDTPESIADEAWNKDFAVEEHLCDDAEIILVGYGIISRILKTVVEKCRKRGIKAGLVRPKVLWPFPTAVFERLAKTASQFLVVEMSCGQMVEDVKLSVDGKKPVFFFGRTGGTVPSDFEILNEVDKLVRPD